MQQFQRMPHRAQSSSVSEGNSRGFVKVLYVLPVPPGPWRNKVSLDVVLMGEAIFSRQLYDPGGGWGCGSCNTVATMVTRHPIGMGTLSVRLCANSHLMGGLPEG